MFGNQAPDSGNGEIIAHRRHAGAEARLRRPAARRRAALGVLDDRAGRRRVGPDGDPDARGPRRRRVGHQRPQVVQLQRVARGLPDRDGGHRPRRAAPPARLDVHRPGRHARREHPPRRPDHGVPGRPQRRSTAATPRSSTRTSASPPRRCSARRARASRSPSSGSAPGGSTTACASSACRERAFDMLCERATYRESHGKRLGEHQTIQNWIADSAAEMHAARLMTLHAAWVADRDGFADARREISLIKFFGVDALSTSSTARCRSTARSATRPTCRSRRCTATRAARASTTAPTSCTGAVAARLILKGYEPPADGVRASTCPPAGPRPRSATDTRSPDMSERWFEPEELEQLSRPDDGPRDRGDRGGRPRGGKRLCGEMKHEWLMLHDLMAESVLGLVTYIQAELGDEGVRRRGSAGSSRGWRRHHDAIQDLDRRSSSTCSPPPGARTPAAAWATTRARSPSPRTTRRSRSR